MQDRGFLRRLRIGRVAGARCTGARLGASCDLGFQSKKVRAYTITALGMAPAPTPTGGPEPL